MVTGVAVHGLISLFNVKEADLGVVGVKKLHGADEGADDAGIAHGAQHLARQALRLGPLRAARRLGSASRQQGAC